MCVLHKFNHLIEVALLPRLFYLYFEGLIAIHRSPNDLIAFCFLSWFAFASQHAFVKVALALHYDTISGELFVGLNEYNVILL